MHCGEIVICNIRLPKNKPQKYCSRSDCQNARRQEWRKNKYRQSEDYRIQCSLQQKKWRQDYPADQYQKNYRESHPDYVARNRLLQRERNKKWKVTQQPATILEQTDMLQPGFDGDWLLCEVVGTKIVKRYALSVYSNDHEGSAFLGLEGTKIVKRYAFMAGDP